MSQSGIYHEKGRSRVYLISHYQVSGLLTRITVNNLKFSQMAAFLRNLKQSVLGSFGVAHEGVVEFLQNRKHSVLISIF